MAIQILVVSSLKRGRENSDMEFKRSVPNESVIEIDIAPSRSCLSSPLTASVRNFVRKYFSMDSISSFVTMHDGIFVSDEKRAIVG